MKKFNARSYMVQAVDVMRRSIAEPRTDGKVSPRVGAVLVDLDEDGRLVKRVSFACRGELRYGDHAEYTLLERKNYDQKLDHSVLFATLEPCAPQARNFPKLGCAERIVLSRIKEVWIGIEDPDPTVDRRGIKYLEDNGVKVLMFDRDLQEVIRVENKRFIEQALERAEAAVDAKPKEVSLSSLEAAAVHGRYQDLSVDALDAYRASAKIGDSVESTEFKLRLVRQGLLRHEKDQFIPTGFGLLLFGLEPRIAMPQAGLLATIHYPDGTEEVRDFDGPQVFVPQEVLKWIEDKLPNIIDRSQAARLNKNADFMQLVREGVVNALVHRDYSIGGAKCQMSIFPTKVDIRSPGLPVSPITLDQMKEFNAPMLSRNPVLHYVFAKMDLAEERGLGLKSMRQQAELAALQRPTYTWDDPYLVLSLFPTANAAVTMLPVEKREALADSEKRGWQWLSVKGRTNSAAYSDAIGVDIRTARRHLNHFIALELVRPAGSGPSTEYEVL